MIHSPLLHRKIRAQQQFSHFPQQFKRWKLILGNIEESSEDGTLSDRKTTFSRLKLRPNSADNQATYACEADHPALRGGRRRAARPMRASVLLSVLCKSEQHTPQYLTLNWTDPPEKPEIQGYTSGETIRMGETVTLVCQAYGGNPLASIVWYRNGEPVDTR